METLLSSEEQLAASPDAARPIVLQPLMAYTRRPVGYEVRCSLPWGGEAGCASWHGEKTAPAREMATFFTEQAGEALPLFAIPFSMRVEDCRAALPAGALLLLEPPQTAAPAEGELTAHCAALQAAGFKVGISRYRGEMFWKPAFPYLSHIRSNYKAGLVPKQKELMRSSLRRQTCFVANGVETAADLRDAMDCGFQLFQGNFARRTARRHWPEGEFQQHALLLHKACHPEGATLELLTDVLSCGNLSIRFGNLLASTGVAGAGIAADREVLFSELGSDRAQQLMQVNLFQAITGNASAVFLCSLFQTARFHELMRSCATSSSSLTARFEGLILGALSAMQEGTSKNADVEHAAEILKHKVGMHMACSSFYRNQAIEFAISDADWNKGEQLGGEDGYSASTLSRLYLEARNWARSYVMPLLA